MKTAALGTVAWITAMIVFTALLFPAHLAAQDSRYKPIDLSTFGGPSSFVNTTGSYEWAQVLNNHGTVVGLADTSTPDTNPSPSSLLTDSIRMLSDDRRVC
jgi:hypothetical protein